MEENTMSIAPAGIPQPSSEQRWMQPIARRVPSDPAVDSNSQTQPANNATGSDTTPSPASPDLDLTKLIGQLSRQLKQIEQTFMRALQSLARNVESTGAAAPAAGQTGPISQGRPSAYDGLIRRTAQRNELDPALLSAVVRQESGFDPGARSSAGAMGLMQLMPDTAKSLGVSDPYNAAQNLEGGARMLRGLIDRYGGRLDLALAAYNAGSGAVDKYGGIPPYAETRNYVHAILGEYRASALGA
jgi:soluble lytic murein transglycosylase-like protein